MHSLDPILRPKSIAVIGASRKESSIGFQILDNLLRHGFEGPVYPINPHAASIHSIAAYPRIGEVPGPVDLAVVVVPKEHVLAVVKESVDAGVKGFVVISAGFREIGGEGEAREAALLDAVRARGLRMCPITDADAEVMIREVKMRRLLDAIRGEPARDTGALVDALLRLSQLALAHPEIAEMDVNPLISLERGAVAVDSRIQLAV